MKKLTLSAFLLLLISLLVSTVTAKTNPVHERGNLLDVTGEEVPQIGIAVQVSADAQDEEGTETETEEGDDLAEGTGETGDVDDADCEDGGEPDIVLHKINGPNASKSFTARHYCGMLWHSYWQELGPPLQIWKKIGPNLWKKVAP